jgi:hypothetical protein
MTALSGTAHQLMLDFEPGLADRHATALDCVRQCIYTNRNPLKTVAADMDMSASELSRKLSGNPDDSRRFTLDDLESYITSTGDTTPVYYFVEKYLENDGMRKQRALAELLKCAPQFLALMKQATAE